MHMGGFVLYEERQPKKVLFLSDMERLLKEGRIELPTITEEEIQDRSKGDGLSKAIVIGQTSWFMIQVIARYFQRLDITQVELVTVALAALNGTMYFLWWNKPLDVRCSIPIHYLNIPKPIHERHIFIKPSASMFPNFLLHFFFQDLMGKAETQTLYQKSKDSSTFINLILDVTRIRRAMIAIPILPWLVLQAFYRHLMEILDKFDGERQDDSVPFFWTSRETLPKFASRCTFASLFIAILFGAIHCAGWFFIFLSPAESILWRACSAVLVGAPALLLYIAGVTYFLLSEGVREPGEPLSFAEEKIVAFIILLYIIARLLILGECFVSLRDLPPGAYAVVRWTTFIPHI
jgi:hypothetical protein